MINPAALLLSYAAGGLATLSPCILPVLPLLLSGMQTRHRVAPLLMALGITISFTAMGLMIAVSGKAFGLSPGVLRPVAALMLITAAAFLLIPSWSEWLARALGAFASSAQEAANKFSPEHPVGVFVIGLLLGVVWAPCTGPVLGAAAALAAEAGHATEAALRMWAFGLGAVTPLLLAAYGSRALFQKLKAASLKQGYMLRRVFGGLLLALGLMILTGLDTELEAVFVKALPPGVLRFITQI